MKKSTLMKLFFSLAVVFCAAYITFTKPIKLGLDLKGGVYAVLEAEEKDTKLDPQSMDRLVEVLDRRINGMGVAESAVQKTGNNRVIIELPGVENTEEAVQMIGKTALMEFKIQNEDGTLGETLLTGSALKKAAVSYDNLGRPQIQFEMTQEGAVKFAEITRNNIGKKLAITLDGKIQTAPMINTEIAGGNGVISGSYTVEEAKATATLLNAGALPVKAEIVETRTVGASLGDESIAQSAKAGILAVALIGLFMLVLYRLPGIIAILALLSFGAITFGALNFIDATLTLPGIAGIILSIGMAVDANVIIFERIKDELKFGNTVKGAIDAGFSKGFSSIFDGQVTTLLITTVLFIFGTGAVKGFAVTLTIGTIASMFTALTLTKALLLTFIEVFNLTKPELFGIKKGGENA
ncbi:MAG: protein translocase subunit SecD [Fusobacteriaceae bacterium]|nr:protein translocase subunit SecD [Fusobacteriaceae bacterium]MBP9510348.1 protein translocase subunit SecD [Fusobacteriaceae bacterium]